ncbi:MAG: SIS domain-containing protein [Candidatus Margulisiibacteriota bacterium]
MDTYIDKYLSETEEIIEKIDRKSIETMVDILAGVKKACGRLFILGVGGSSANASHAVNDFRKICGIEAYSPTDNVSELTARVNDDGWNSVFVEWLKVSRLDKKDCILVFSVGGGDAEKNISVNLIEAIKYAKSAGSKIIGIVGRNGGYTAKTSDCAVVVPVVDNETITPHSEAFQAVIWHLIVSHPKLKSGQMKWESQK